jgi:hypothetical protein
MSRIRRGNFIFVAWVGDHAPRHVHVYKDRRLIVKWDLENQRAMRGRATRRILEHLRSLEEEALL